MPYSVAKKNLNLMTPLLQTRCLRALICGLLCLLSACSANVPTRYYALEALLTNKAAATSTKTSKPALIGIGPLSLPALLNRKGIVTLLPNSAINIAEAEQWAEPLLDNMTRVLTRNIAALHPHDIVYAYPWSLLDAVEQRLVINILQFDAKLGGTLVLDAAWTLKDEQSQRVLKRGHSHIRHPLASAEYPALVAGMNQVLAEFSAELAAAW